jgi:hypothetical protein
MWSLAAAAALCASAQVATAQGSDVSLSAEGSFHPLVYAPGLHASLRALVDTGRAMEPEGICYEQVRDSTGKEKLVPHDFSHARGRLVTMEREANETLAYQSFGSVALRNTGGAAARRVAVELPFAGEFSVVIPGQPTVLGRLDGAVPVGDIPPGGSATVTFWTGVAAASVAFHERSRVVHSQGAAAIRQPAGKKDDAAGPTPPSPWLLADLALTAAIAGGVALLLARRK